jgi:translocation and assembly module TamB
VSRAPSLPTVPCGAGHDPRSGRGLEATVTMGRAFRIVVAALAGAVVLVCLVVGGTLTVARTSWGGEHVRRLALPRVNSVLAGQIEIRQFRFLGDRIILDGLSVREPDGDLVARAARLEVGFSPVGLLRGRLNLRDLIIDQPLLSLRMDKNGETNLGRALSGKTATAPRAVGDSSRTNNQAGSGLAVEVGALSVRGGTIDVRDQRDATAPFLRHVRVTGIEAKATGRYGGGPGKDEFGVHLDLRADATEPLRAPVTLLVDGRGSAGRPKANADLSLQAAIGDNEINLRAQIQAAETPEPGRSSDQAVHATVDVKRIHLVPSLFRLVAPGSPLKAAVTMSGRAAWDGSHDAAWAKVTLAAAGTSVAIEASVAVARRSIDGLSVHARGIDLARLIDDGPPSDLSVDLVAHGEGHDLRALRGAATFSMPPGRLGGYAIGPIRLRADADRGRYKVMDLVAVIPGVSASGAGEATAERIAFQGAVDVRDLGATVRSLMAGNRSGVPPAAGHGRIDIAVAGNPQAPSLSLKGQLGALRWQDIRIPSLRLSASLPDLRKPLASSVTLQVPEASVGARTFRGVSVMVRGAGPRFDARLALAAPEALTVEAGGTWSAGRTQIAFDRFLLASRRARWTLARPMRLVFTGDVVRIVGLELRTKDAQTIQLDLEKTARGMRADLALSAIDLTKLPESLMPPRLELAGRLDAEAHLKGAANRPTVEARATLTHGRIGNLRDMALTVDTRLDNGRASGHLDLGVLGATVVGRFDLPMVWPPPAASPLMAQFEAANIDLQRVMNGIKSAQDQLATEATVVIAKPPMDVRGKASFSLKLGGKGEHPELILAAEVRQLTVAGTVAGDIAIGVDAAGKKPISARLELKQVSGAGGLATASGVVKLRTGFSLGALIHHPPSSEKILSTPAHFEASLKGVKLAPLALLTSYPRKLDGSASLDADLDGTPRTARGNIKLTLTAVSSGRFPPTDGVLQVKMGERDTRADAQVTRRGATLFTLAARVDAPVGRIRDPGAFADIPVEVHAVLGPLDLQRVGLPPDTDRHPARILKGQVRAQADVTGTLRAPHLTFRADATDIRMDQTPIGSGVVLVGYVNRKISGDLAAVSANGGRLHLVASSNADLGYPAIVRGLDPRQMAIKARLDAKGFDVSGLSGATPGLRTVAGQLFAGMDVAGTAIDPRPSGRLEWKEGALTITGMGEYKHIHLLVHGDTEHVVLDELGVDSGGGHARVTGSGDHRSGSGYGLKATVDLKDFPAYVEGQALAAISLRASTDSQVSVQRVRAKVSIDSARVTLSDAKRKHLQKLAQPADVVLTDAGAPLNAAHARKLAAATAALATLAEKKATAAVAAAHAPPARPAGVVVLVDAPRNLWISGKDANVELGLQPGFRVEVTDVTRVFGQIMIKRGRVDVVGRRFDLKAESTARFMGPPDLPELDIAAKHVNEEENITVLVTVKGTPEHLRIAISAPDRPDLTETQLYTLIATGRLTFGGGTASSSTPTDRAVSLVGGLVAAQLQKSLSKKLPFDVLTIEAENGGPRLEAGTYLTSDLYVGYVGRLGADPARLQNRNAVHLEYELGSHWSFQGEYGDAKTGSADVIWTRRY